MNVKYVIFYRLIKKTIEDIFLLVNILTMWQEMLGNYVENPKNPTRQLLTVVVLVSIKRSAAYGSIKNYAILLKTIWIQTINKFQIKSHQNWS